MPASHSLLSMVLCVFIRWQPCMHANALMQVVHFDGDSKVRVGDCVVLDTTLTRWTSERSNQWIMFENIVHEVNGAITQRHDTHLLSEDPLQVWAEAAHWFVLCSDSFAVLCWAVPCCVLLCCAWLCCTVLCGAVGYCAVLCCAVWCGAVQCCAVLWYAVPCGAVRRGALLLVLCNAVVSAPTSR